MKKQEHSTRLKLPKQRPPRMDLRYTKKKKITPTNDPKNEVKKNLPQLPTMKATDDLFLVLGEQPDLSFEYAFDEPQANKVRQKLFRKSFPTTGFSYLVLNSNKWVFTQATAVSSVNFVPYNNWEITPDTTKYINANGNAWDTELLLSCYKTFIGAMNLKDHITPQEGGLIYGIVLDARPRKIKTDSGFVVYIDTIIATCRAIDNAWATAIKRGAIKFLSVGFDCDYLQCSKCGHIYMANGTGICEHTAFELNKNYFDEYGNMSKVSAMPTSNEGLGNLIFQELSYLSVDPAFHGAVQSHLIKVPNDTNVKFKIPNFVLERPAIQALLPYLKVVPITKDNKNKLVTPNDKIYRHNNRYRQKGL